MKYRIRHAILDAIWAAFLVGLVGFGIPTLFFIAVQ